MSVYHAQKSISVFVANIGEKADFYVQNLVAQLRKAGISAERDYLGRSVKAQMKYADKAFAKYVLVIGDNEIAENSAELRDMRGGERVKVALSVDAVIEQIKA